MIQLFSPCVWRFLVCPHLRADFFVVRPDLSAGNKAGISSMGSQAQVAAARRAQSSPARLLCATATGVRSTAGQPSFAVNRFLVLPLEYFPPAAGEVAVTNGKTTSLGDLWEEGKTGETYAENLTEISGKSLLRTNAAICHVECLLKACASRQEKPSRCCKNGAAGGAMIRHPRLSSARKHRRRPAVG